MLIAQDNGIGMNLEVLQKYFLNIGSSYYRSKEFQKVRNSLINKGVDFDPVSRFGIGILSYFMISDQN